VTTTTTTTTTTTISTPPDTSVSIGVAITQLDAYIGSEARREEAAARAVRQTWNGYLYTPPVNADGDLVAVVAFSYDPNAKPLQVLGYAHDQWNLLIALSPPPGQGDVTPSGAAMNSYWLADFNRAAISVGDVTGAGRPAFLIPLDGADNVPGALVSQAGATAAAPWRWVPFTEGSSTTPFYVVTRSPAINGSTLVSTYDNCTPDCAGGTNYTIRWIFEPDTGGFWAPSPP
jgi:hypothetical protein